MASVPYLSNDRAEPASEPLIVLAEDCEETREAYGIILRHHGYCVEEAGNGADAIELVRRLHPDLVLMDIGLPTLDGWQASRALKSDPATRAIPLVAFSARVDSTADLAGSAATFDGYILKPVNPADLVQRVNAYLTLLGRRCGREGDGAVEAWRKKGGRA